MQWPKDNRTNNDLQNTTLKTKDRATRIPIKTDGELRCSERVGRSFVTSDIRRVTKSNIFEYTKQPNQIYQYDI
jgi:hypothetical protein